MPTLNLNEPSRPWKPEREAHGRRKAKWAGYRTYKWVKARKVFLSANPLCIECKRNGDTRTANVVDHIIRATECADPWDSKNWQPLCTPCHNSKSGKEAHHTTK